MPLGQFPSADKYVDDIAKTGSKSKKLDGRGAKDMPAMMNARKGSGVVTNNVVNGLLMDPRAVKVFISSRANFNSAPAPSAGTRPWPRCRSLCTW